MVTGVKKDINMHVAHLPSHWVSGVYKEEEWIGEFYATPDELLIWCEEEYQDELVVKLVLDLCDAQKVYEEWWGKLQEEIQ